MGFGVLGFRVFLCRVLGLRETSKAMCTGFGVLGRGFGALLFNLYCPLGGLVVGYWQETTSLKAQAQTLAKILASGSHAETF